MSEGLFYYIGGSVIFVMATHFMIHIKREFSFFVMVGLFVLGGFMGGVLDSYITGFLFAMVATFLLW